MITYEQDSDHYYDIGGKDEILNLLFKKLQDSVEVAKRTQNWVGHIYDISEFSQLIGDINDNAKSDRLIALTIDTPSGNWGWGYVRDIDIEDIY